MTVGGGRWGVPKVRDEWAADGGGGGGGVERVLVGALAAAAAGRTSSSHEVFEFRRLKKVDSEL